VIISSSLSQGDSVLSPNDSWLILWKILIYYDSKYTFSITGWIDLLIILHFTFSLKIHESLIKLSNYFICNIVLSNLWNHKHYF
jgi:hypothetical protein